MNLNRQTRELLSRALFVLGLGLAVLILAPAAQAQTLIYKTNNTNPLQTNTSWTNSTGGAGGNPAAVNANEIGVFDSTVGSANAAQAVTAAMTIGGFKVLNPGAALTMNGTGAVETITIGNTTNTTDIDLTNATRSLTILSNITLKLANAQTWAVGNGTTTDTLTVNGAVNTNAFGLTLSGNGTISIGGIISSTGGLTLGSSTLTTVLSGANSMTGTTTLSAGTLDINNNTALGNNAGILTITGGSIDATVAGISISKTNAENWNGDFSFIGTNSLNLGTGAVTLNASRTVTISANTLTVGGGISGTGFSLTKDGAGTLDLTGIETYTGGTILNAGVLEFNGTNSFTAGTVTMNGGTLDFNNASALGNNAVILTFNGGNLDATNGVIVNSKTNAMNWNADFTFIGTNSLNLGTGAVTMNASRTVTISANTLTVGGVISGTGFSLTKNGTGTMNLTSASSNFNGVTTINGGTLSVSTLALGGSVSSIGNSTNAASNLIINGGTLQYLGASAQTTDRLFTIGTNGATLDSSNATAANTITFSNTSAIVFSSSTAPATLTLTGLNTGTNILDSIIGDAGTGPNITTVDKTGAGKWELNAVNTFTGNLNMSVGTIVFGKATAIQDAVLNFTGGTVTLFAGANNMAGLAGTAGNNITIGTDSLNITTTSGVTSTYLGNIVTGAGSIVIAGAGTEAFNGTSSNYTGSTTINGGTLSVNTLALGGTVSSIGNSTNAAANLIINGGTLQYLGASAQTTDRLFTIGSAGATLDSSNLTTGNTITFSNTSTVVFTGTNVSPTLTLTGVNNGINVLDIIIANNGTGTTTVNKTGAGNWELNAVNTFTGNMNLSAGTLTLGKATAVQDAVLNFTGGTVSLFLGANNMAGLAGTAGNNITIGTNSLNITTVTGVTSTFSGNIVTGTGSVVIAGAGTEAFNGTSSNYTGSTTISGGTLAVNTLALGGVVSSIGNSTNAAANLIINGGTLQYTGAGATTDRLFTIGLNGATLDASGTGVLTMSNASTVLYSGGFNMSPTLTLTGSNAGANTLDAILSNNGTGTTALTKSGAGEWVLAGANTYTGVTTINGGTLSVSSLALGGSASGIGQSTNAAANLIINGGTLQYTGAGATTDRLFTIGVNGATLDASGTGVLTMSNASTIVYTGTNISPTLTLTGSNTGANTLAAIIANNGTGATSLVKNGAGEWILTGAESYTGGTTINVGTLEFNGTNTFASGTVTLAGGTLDLNNNNALGSAAVVLTITGGNLDATNGAFTNAFANAQNWNGDFTVTGTNNLNLGTGAVTLGASRTVTVSANTLTVGGAIGGSGFGLTKNGTGNLILTGADTYTGGTTINAGMLSFNGANTFTAGTVTISGGTLNFNNANALGSAAVILTFNGGNIDATNGAVTNAFANAQNWNSDFTFTGTNSLNLGTGAVTMNASRIVTVSANTLTVGGAISGTGFGLTKNGAGTLDLTGAESYTGGTTVNAGTLEFNGTNTFASGTVTLAGGTLDLNNNNALGSSAVVLTITGGNLDATNGAFTNAFANAQNWNGNFTVTGTNNLNLGTGAVTLGASRTVTVSANTLTVGGAISGTGFSLTKNGTGTLSLTSATSNYNGVTTINAGILSVSTLAAGGSVSSIGNSTNAAANLIINGGTLQYLGSGAATDRLFTIGSSGATIDSSGTGALTMNNTGSIAYTGTNISPTLTLTGTNTGANTLAGIIANNGTGVTSVVKNGAGNWTLTGANTYTGGTTINNGLLEVTGNNSLGAAGSPVTVASGATLQLDNNFDITGAGATSGSSNGSLLTISGAGVGGNGALINGNGTAEWQGNIALGADATIGSGSTGGGCITIGNNGSSFTSNVSLGAHNLTLVGGPSTTTQVNANITGTGNVTVNTDATSTVLYEMDGNGYTGTTFVNNGTLILDTTSSSVGLLPGSGNLLAINGPLVIGDGVGAANTAVVQLGITSGDLARNVIAMNSNVTINSDGFFNVNGQDQIINNLSMNAGLIDTTSHVSGNFGTLTITGNATIGTNAITSVIDGNFEMANSVGNLTTNFTVTAGGNATSDFTINALLSGGSMIKSGNGTMVLTNNANSYTGTTEIQAGTLNIQASGALGANGNNAPAEGTTVDVGGAIASPRQYFRRQ